MRVALFVTCLVDQLWPSVGVATVQVLRRAGCEVSFDARQTCCGQPAFNTGYRSEAKEVARKTIELLEEQRADAIVLPSGSCTAMTHLWKELFHDEPEWRERSEAVAARTHELAGFLVKVLGKEEFGARFDARVSWHDACHGLRELGLRDEPRRLLQGVAGLELVEAQRCESCCGFGGTFSVKYPEISVAMLDRKLDELHALHVDAVVSGDVSCLMQIGGRLARRGMHTRPLHIAEVLARTS
jgi:L-lactate dehydrogenase complex protein LldE